MNTQNSKQLGAASQGSSKQQGQAQYQPQQQQQAPADPLVAGFLAAYAEAEPMPNIPEMGAVWGPMGDALTAILESPDSDISQVLGGAVSQIQGN